MSGRMTEAQHRDALVLIALAGNEPGFYSNFACVQGATGLSRDEVRRACRRLRKAGLAEFRNGLWTDAGDMAGAGYTATADGRVRALELEIAMEEA